MLALAMVGDVDEDGKVNVVLYDIGEDGTTNTSDSYVYTAGLFYSGDFVSFNNSLKNYGMSYMFSAMMTNIFLRFMIILKGITRRAALVGLITTSKPLTPKRNMQTSARM